MFGQKKTNQIIIHSVRPLHGCRGLQISKYSPCSEPIETLLFVCGSLCCLCFPVPSLFLLIFLHFSLCSDLVDKFIILLPAQNSDHPTMPATKEGIHLELKYFQSQHTDLSDRTSYQLPSSTSDHITSHSTHLASRVLVDCAGVKLFIITALAVAACLLLLSIMCGYLGHKNERRAEYVVVVVTS